MGGFDESSLEKNTTLLVGSRGAEASERVSLPGQQGKIRITEFLIVVAQLALLAFVIRQFQIESSAFLRIALLSFVGFMLHSFLPLRFRQPFFLLLCFASIGMVFGLPNGAWLVGIGLLLIAICHLPVPFSARVTLLLLTGTLLAVFRVDWLHAPWSRAIWPILGSMFMFRLIVYLYDLRHEKEPVSVWRTLAYFFLLPNVCFPLFPVVDYKTFRRTYYNDDPYRIYQVGVDWMLRGVIHLILYRFVYQYLTMAPFEVKAPGDLVRYLIANFLLYLRVSGQFHIIVGMLHLFGFHLPESHHRYYLASSFTDFWRRINIYWKDFMLKVFYFPIYFKLRTWGTFQALVTSTLIVFFITWFLHSLQFFWVRGSFLFAWQDVCFWAVLGLLVVINAVYEARHGRERTLRKSSWTPRGFAALCLKTAGTFSVICILWSLWTSESISAWISLWSSLGEKTAGTARLFPTLLVAAVVLGEGASRIRGSGISKIGQPRPEFSKSTAISIASLLILSLAGIQEAYTRFGSTAATLINSLRSGKLSRLDNATLERGYYENLLQVDRFNTQLWEVYTNKPLNWLDVQGTGLERFTNDFQQKELIPSFRSLTKYGTVSTNRWGMRDRDYERQPSPGTFRIALLGASSVMGWGVQDKETFEWILEDRLNHENQGKPYAKYEILNFAVPGYQPPQQLKALEKALSFGPDVVFYVATGREAQRSTDYLIEVTRKGIYIPYDYLREIVQKVGIEAKTAEPVGLRRLEPFRDEILVWLYRRIVQGCRERGTVPVWIFLPMTIEDPWQDDTATLFQIAREAGFVVLNLIDVYKNQDIKSLRVAGWDTHPNAKAHELIAGKLYEALWEREQDIIRPRPSTFSQQSGSQAAGRTGSQTTGGIVKDGRN